MLINTRKYLLTYCCLFVFVFFCRWKSWERSENSTTCWKKGLVSDGVWWDLWETTLVFWLWHWMVLVSNNSFSTFTCFSFKKLFWGLKNQILSQVFVWICISSNMVLRHSALFWELLSQRSKRETWTRCFSHCSK